MSRAPFQVLVFPYRLSPSGEYEFAIFRRAEGYWQGIAGGGEDDETPSDAAKREAWEEAGIPLDTSLFPLDSCTRIPVVNIGGFYWGKDVLVIPEYCFGLEITNDAIGLSDEHTEYQWTTYLHARECLKWDSNKTALWELNHRLTSTTATILADQTTITFTPKQWDTFQQRLDEPPKAITALQRLFGEQEPY